LWTRFMVNRGQRRRWWLTGAWPHSCFSAQNLTVTEGKWKGSNGGPHRGQLRAVGQRKSAGDEGDRWWLLKLAGVAFRCSGDGVVGGERCGVEWGCSQGLFIGSRNREATGRRETVWWPVSEGLHYGVAVMQDLKGQENRSDRCYFKRGL
jgi:hypothetical protein